MSRKPSHLSIAWWRCSQSRALAALVRAIVAGARGHHQETLAAAEEAYEVVVESHAAVPVDALVYAAEAAFALGHLDKVDELISPLAALAPFKRTLSVQTHEARLQARLAARRGERDTVEPSYRRAAAYFRELGTPFWLAGQLSARLTIQALRS
ncbi:MAG: hypothetical protein H0U03_12965 [Actinobacteria bacterium]|nr:hypothetical protein [Actinomycetota bacterium]